MRDPVDATRNGHWPKCKLVIDNLATSTLGRREMQARTLTSPASTVRARCRAYSAEVYIRRAYTQNIIRACDLRHDNDRYIHLDDVSRGDRELYGAVIWKMEFHAHTHGDCKLYASRKFIFFIRFDKFYHVIVTGTREID